MINKINFCGNVYQTSKVQQTSDSNEIAQIQKEADEKDRDVFIYAQDKYYDGKSCYYGIEIDDRSKLVFNRTFDFKFPDCSEINSIYSLEDYKNL